MTDDEKKQRFGDEVNEAATAFGERVNRAGGLFVVGVLDPVTCRFHCVTNVPPEKVVTFVDEFRGDIDTGKEALARAHAQALADAAGWSVVVTGERGKA